MPILPNLDELRDRLAIQESTRVTDTAFYLNRSNPVPHRIEGFAISR